MGIRTLGRGTVSLRTHLWANMSDGMFVSQILQELSHVGCHHILGEGYLSGNENRY